ncbi:MAG: hypothetical protein V1872_03910 [bacterium]
MIDGEGTSRLNRHLNKYQSTAKDELIRYITLKKPEHVISNKQIFQTGIIFLVFGIIGFLRERSRKNLSETVG